ncbi:LemA family protein [Streptococcus sp. 20-1249]|uniref:LemA family protein n=1 Tax=Streptococcus hepaticus TaxID=3349163 RepID=UPI003749B6FE
MILATLLWSFIFSMTTTPEDAEMTVEPFKGAIFYCALATAIVVYIILNYQHAVRLNSAIDSCASNIKITAERNKQLLDKANKFVDKHLSLEKESVLEVQKNAVLRESSKSTERETNREDSTDEKFFKNKGRRDQLSKGDDKHKSVESSKEFAQILHDIPEYNMNKHVNRLFEEILKSEEDLAAYRQHYNYLVEQFNGMIKQFPLSLIRRLTSLKAREYYKIDIDEEFSDQLLGL